MEWISVEHELPPIDSELCYDGYEKSVEVLLFYIGSLSHVVTGFYHVWDKENHWTISGRDGYSIEGKVTHWMPLPDPPASPEKFTALWRDSWTAGSRDFSLFKLHRFFRESGQAMEDAIKNSGIEIDSVDYILKGHPMIQGETCDDVKEWIDRQNKRTTDE